MGVFRNENAPARYFRNTHQQGNALELPIHSNFRILTKALDRLETTGSRRYSAVAQWQSIRLLTEGL